MEHAERHAGLHVKCPILTKIGMCCSTKFNKTQAQVSQKSIPHIWVVTYGHTDTYSEG
jgi:hypothetical protein